MIHTSHFINIISMCVCLLEENMIFSKINGPVFVIKQVDHNLLQENLMEE